MLSCLVIMGNMFISDGASFVAMEKVTVGGFDRRNANSRLLVLRTIDDMGSSFDVSQYPADATPFTILADCADRAEDAG